jgi:hypothetical protein
VIVDRSHVRWALTSVSLTLLALILYWIYALSEPNGPSGGSWQGMLFGMAGTGCMIYAGLLAWRKKIPKWQVGSAQTWLRGHIWIGLLSVPLILCHSGFRWGGALEFCLMLTFAVVILSGIYGLAVQQILPRVMTSIVPAQAIAPQLDVACERLRRSTELAVQKVCENTFLEPFSANSRHSEAFELAVTSSEINSSIRERNLNRSKQTEFSPKFELSTFYWGQLDSFLSSDASRLHELANPTLAAARFARLRNSVTEDLQPAIDEMESACDERRQLLFQARIHWWLHGWLHLHVPLCLTLLVLGLLHIVTAIYY